MSVRDLIPWNRGNNQAPALGRGDDMDPFLLLHRNINRLFDEALRGLDARFGGVTPRSGMWPSVEFSETDKEIQVTAELPGLEENDVEVLLEDGVLTLRGEKNSKSEDQDRQFSERYYGRFERRLVLGREIEEGKVAATFKNGVLTVTLPKSETAAANAKRVPINSRK